MTDGHQTIDETSHLLGYGLSNGDVSGYTDSNRLHNSAGSDDQTTHEPVATIRQLVRRHLVTMAMLHVAQFLTGMGFSMIAPFFPK